MVLLSALAEVNGFVFRYRSVSQFRVQSGTSATFAGEVAGPPDVAEGRRHGPTALPAQALS
jgi:hypothetical protein